MVIIQGEMIMKMQKIKELYSYNIEDIDKECRELIMVLNSLPNVVTTLCCSGHCKEQYIIFFICNDFAQLGRLYRCVDKNYSDGKWRIEISGTDVCPANRFLLCSNKVFTSEKEMMKSVNALIDNINYWQNSRFDNYFYAEVL